MSGSIKLNQKQLLNLQRDGENKYCFECKTSNPQWASPKYGIFICLECAGTHRSLGVHISFVRSVTMDQFKPEELKLMEIGGNARARTYFEEHGVDNTVSIVDKYNSTVAEDYREMLSAEANGQEWTRRDRPVHIPKTNSTHGSQGIDNSGNGGSDRAVKQFQKPLGEQEPTLNDLASEAVGALTSGWGWFSKAVTQTVTETTNTYIRPSVRQLTDSELGENARRAVVQFGRRAREAGAYSAEQFNKYAGETLGGVESENQPKSEYAHLFEGWEARATPKADSQEPSDTSEVQKPEATETKEVAKDEPPKATFRASTDNAKKDV